MTSQPSPTVRSLNVQVHSQELCVAAQGSAISAMSPLLIPVRLDNLTRHVITSPYNSVDLSSRNSLGWCTFPGMQFATKKYLALFGEQYICGSFYNGSLDGNLYVMVNSSTDYDNTVYPVYFSSLYRSQGHGWFDQGVGFTLRFDPVIDPKWKALWLMDFTHNESYKAETLEMPPVSNKTKKKNDNSKTSQTADSQREVNP